MTAWRKAFRQLRGDSTLSIADQVLVSGLNFAVGIVAARVLGVADFGLFALILMIANLAGVASSHLLTLPMTTLVGARPTRLPEYFATILRLGVVFCFFAGVVVAVVIGGIGALRGEEAPVPVLVAAAFLAFGQNIQILVRSVLFVRREYRRALLLDLLRIFILGAGAAAGAAAGWRVGIVPVLLLIGTSSLIVAVPRLLSAASVKVRSGLARRILKRHWPLSRWMLLMMLVSLGQEQALWVIVGVELGDAALGALRAGQYLLGTTHFLVLALEHFMPRNAAEEFRRGGESQLRRYLARQTLIFGGASGALILLIAIFAGPLLSVFFGASYAEFAGITRVFALVYMAAVVRSIWTYYLRTVERTRAIFQAFAASSATAILLVYPAIAALGIAGVAWTMAIAQMVCLGLILLAVARHESSPAADGHGGRPAAADLRNGRAP